MLLDRACPDGGWNAGNGVVYGSGMAPHPDDTATALLVLNDRRQHPVVKSSIRYLEQVAPTLTAPWSLAWTILALAAYGRQIDSLRRSLVAIPDLLTIEDTSTLAVVCLALDHHRTLSVLGVMS
jgi:wyosine [tRNA(Phe)-imidazoG37] synthetase (radical SAM superfamily)